MRQVAKVARLAHVIVRQVIVALFAVLLCRILAVRFVTGGAAVDGADAISVAAVICSGLLLGGAKAKDVEEGARLFKSLFRAAVVSRSDSGGQLLRDHVMKDGGVLRAGKQEARHGLVTLKGLKGVRVAKVLEVDVDFLTPGHTGQLCGAQINQRKVENARVVALIQDEGAGRLVYSPSLLSRPSGIDSCGSSSKYLIQRGHEYDMSVGICPST